MVRIGANRDAWGYLMETVSTLELGVERAGHASAYYMAEGTSPGTWRGTATQVLGLDTGTQVEESHLHNLFGEGTHPITGEALGAKYLTPASFEERVQATLMESLLDPENRDLSVEELHDKAVTTVQEKPVRESVAGFEFVFSPPKSVSSWWALADPQLKNQIREAHHTAIEATIDMLETDVIRTRLGEGGVAQVTTNGLIAATFDHWDSREGDPQLHTHMLVSNKAQTADGKWRTIDSRALYPAVSTAGAHYDTVLMDELSTRFGIEWTTQDVLDNPAKYREWRMKHNRADTPASRYQFSLDTGVRRGSVKWQIAHLPQSLNNEFSIRSRKLNEATDQSVEDYVKRYGRRPSDAQIIRLRQQATLSTRRAKRNLSLKALTADWRKRASKHVGDTFLAAERVLTRGAQQLKRYPLWSFRTDDVQLQQAQEVVQFALQVLGTERSTWKRTNAEKAVYDATAHWRFRSPEDRRATIKRITDQVIAAAVPLTPKHELHTPYQFRNPDGESIFHPTAHDLYTTQEVWDAEERLLEAGRTSNTAVVPDNVLESLIGTPTATEHRTLSDDQQDAVANVLSSGRLVDVLVGPAGAGKTTSLEKLREIWEHTHGEGTVRGLAPTARAAEVLAESLGITTENTATWLHETSAGVTEKDGFNYELNKGDLLIIDEASIAGTIALDTLRAQAESAGAKLLLVGDWAQLAAVDAGGAFGLLASDRPDVAELKALHRFKAKWEADASKLLRLGRSEGLEPYIENGRITWGLDESIIIQAVEAWKADETTLKDPEEGTTLESLLIAPTNDMVERLNDIARQWRIEQGHVDATRTTNVASGVASPGDRIVTRQNARTLRTDKDRWVKNNDEWVIRDIKPNGDIVATAGDENVVLPANYCADHVQLAYATTAHRSQGRTVDTAHTIVDSTASRETFYVAMTRGKTSNKAYVLIDEDGQTGDKAARGMSRTWRETLEAVLQNRGSDIAAHDTLRQEADRIGSIRQLYAEYQTIMAVVLTEEYLPSLQRLDLVDNDRTDSPYLGPLLANLRRLETHGENADETLAELVLERGFHDANDKLAVMHHRVVQHLEALPGQDSQESAIAGLLERAPELHDRTSAAAQALHERENAIQIRAELLLDEALANNEPWVKALGTPVVGNESEWRLNAIKIACYRDMYGVTGSAPVETTATPDKTRARHRNIAINTFAHLLPSDAQTSQQHVVNPPKQQTIQYR